MKSIRTLAVPLLLTSAALGLADGVRRWWRMQRQLEANLRDSSGLNQVARAVLAATGDLTPLMDAAESVARAMGYHHGAVFLVQDSGALGWVVGYGRFAEFSWWEAPRSGQAMLLDVVRERTSFVAVEPSRPVPAGADLPVPGARWQACLPLTLGDRVLGVLIVAKDRPEDDPEQALATATLLAAQLAMGVHNVYRYREREDLAAATERNRLARDIHDGIAQSLYMLTLNLETCMELAERGDGSVGSRLFDSLQFSRNILWETRQYLFDLQPLFSQEGSLAGALEGQIREFRVVSRLPVEFAASGAEPALPAAIRGALYRVAQEALANVFKHARAHRVRVTLAFGERTVCLDIADDGVGLQQETRDPEDGLPATGRGLRNMRQRIAEVGGSLLVDSAPGEGTRIAVTVPSREG